MVHAHCFITDLSISKTTTISLAVCIILYSVARSVVELIQAIHFLILIISNKAARLDLLFRRAKPIVCDMDNWVKLIFFSLAIAFAIQLLLPMNNDLRCTTGCNWQIGAIVIWLSWIELILESTHFRFIGVYAIMLKRVLMSLRKLALLALLLIIGFGFAFHLILYHPEYKVNLQT